MTSDRSRGHHPVRATAASWVALIASTAIVAGCSSSDGGDETDPATEARSAEASSTSAGNVVAEPEFGFCQEMLDELALPNSETVEYTAQSLGESSAAECVVDPEQVTMAAAEGNDIVRLRLGLGDLDSNNGMSGDAADWPEIDDPFGRADAEPYLAEERPDPLRGELRCWDVPNCETGGEIDGRVITYWFQAVHNDVYLTAEVQYLSPEVSENEVEQRARKHAFGLYAGYVAAVSAYSPD